MKTTRRTFKQLLGLGLGMLAFGAGAAGIGEEKAVRSHLADGQEHTVGLKKLSDHGRVLFMAAWTQQDGGGRPLTKGTGKPLSDPGSPLRFPRNFNRVSAPDSNGCSGCHNKPFEGGGGDIVANVFVTGQRFDFATFDALGDPVATRGALDERGTPATLQTIANSRNTLGMFGSGYVELLAREMTAQLRAIRDGIPKGGGTVLAAKGVNFGTLKHNADGSWDASGVTGLPPGSMAGSPPSLTVQPFHQAGAVVSLREFTNNAFNHHHGVQSTERFGLDSDADGDGVKNELTRADVTAATVWQAQLPAPGRMVPRDAAVEKAVLLGERTFAQIGCDDCHVPKLPLSSAVFSEPNPYNPAGNLQPGQAKAYSFNLNDKRLDSPRLKAEAGGVTWVPAYTDLKLHDITAGPGDPNVEPINQHAPAGSAAFFAGNSRFLTRKLWGVANEPPYFHHGQYTTLREAVEAHHGEAEASHVAWTKLSAAERDAVIEFLKSLQVLPKGATSLAVDEKGAPRPWPPK